MRSNKWGFTPWDRETYAKGRQEGWIQKDGVSVKYVNQHGPLTAKNCVSISDDIALPGKKMVAV
jgi:large subunit ribosomal protein L10e